MIKNSMETLESPFGEISMMITRHSEKESNITLLLGQGFSNSMDETLLRAIASALAEEAVTVIRFEYPALKQKHKGLPLVKRFLPVYEYVFENISQRDEFKDSKFFIGGKSLSARMSSFIRSDTITAYIFLGFPLHFKKVPLVFSKKQFVNFNKSMMFIQGANDPYSKQNKMEQLVKEFNPLAYLLMIPEANHSLRLEDETKRTQADVDKEISDIILWFMSDVLEKQAKD